MVGVIGGEIPGVLGSRHRRSMRGCGPPQGAQYKSAGLVGRPSLVPLLEVNSAVWLWSIPRPSACAGARCIVCAPMPAAVATGYGPDLLPELYDDDDDGAANVDIVSSFVVFIVCVGRR